ncbi:MAG: HAMP domain-containing histidine kinase [Treponema sp.]|jgi:signal transduction histidine kinase|nr:HAMP domain-containing histidine kinase [Treponema sp.]
MISLKNRLALTWALFISLALGVLTLVINVFTGYVFTALIKENIAGKSAEIVETIGGQYNPLSRSFDAPSVEAVGMYFVHEGYIITVEDEKGGPVWDARSCDMQQCADVINGITERMESSFRLRGEIQKREYPVNYFGSTVGNISIETYGPFFFSETESKFLGSVNKLLFAAGLVFILLSIAVSVPLSRAIARPVLKAGEATRKIARAHAGGNNFQNLQIRLDEGYKTRELAELSAAVNELAAELEEGERRQKQLTSDIAHELRTPLACLQGNIEAMLDGVWEPGPERLASCHEEVLRLGRLVQDLNTLTSLEWEKLILNKSEFDLSSLLRLTSGQFSAAAREKGIALNLNLAPGLVNADYDRLKQVFINLLSNAVKYTDRGSITVNAEQITEPTEEQTGEASPGQAGPSWLVSVADTGAGIGAEDLPHIFERFYRCDKSRSRGAGGAGIGLTIAAAIIAAHGGSISAESPARGGNPDSGENADSGEDADGGGPAGGEGPEGAGQKGPGSIFYVRLK